MDHTRSAPGTPHIRDLRLTRQRQVVMDVLLDFPEHLDAEMVYSRAKERDPKISLATVYRSLAFLKDAGLVHEFQLGQSRGHFEVAGNIPHYHFTCSRCGCIVEFAAPQIEELMHDLSLCEGLCITEIRLDVTGVCANCLAEQDAQSPIIPQ